MAVGILVNQLVHSKQIDRLEITTEPTKRYTVNSSGNVTFDFSGAVVTAIYKDGVTQVVTPTWSPTSTSITNNDEEKSVTAYATFRGVSVPLVLNVANPVTSIAITSQPTTRTYTVNSSGNATYSFTGAVITATLTNGTTKTVSPEWTPTTGSITDTSTTKTETVTATYGGQDDTTTMTLNNPLSSLAITTQPTTRTYKQNTSFSSAGAVVRATYTNSKTANVAATWSPTTLSTVGNSITVTASYTNGGVTKTATTTVVVKFLPLTYQQVSYVQNTSDVYVDTGFTPNQNTRVTARLRWTNITNTYPGGFGAAQNYNSRAFETYVYSNTVNWNFYNKTYGADGSLGYTGVAVNTTYRIDANKNVYTIKNDSGTTLKTITATNGTFTAPYTLYLFSTHRATPLYGRVRFYDTVKIYDNGTLVRNMVPCYRVSDSVTGFYDTVNSKFYSRSGLTKGGDVNTVV